jgi:hypothetical protein
MNDAHRGWKGQPAGRLNGCGIDPVIVGAARAASTRCSGSTCSNAFVYGCFGSWKMSSTLPCSTTRPRYMTTTSSAISATTPRLCVMSMIAIARSRWMLRRRSRICACVVTSSAVVGSSAMSRFGSHDSATAIIARWRSPPLSSNEYSSMRRSGFGMPTLRSASMPRARASFAVTSLCNVTASIDLRADVCTGLKDVIGSWKTRADLAAADRAYLAAVRRAARRDRCACRSAA